MTSSPSFHQYGAGVVRVAIGEGGLTDLGYCEDDVKVKYIIQEKELHADNFGGSEAAPGEILDLSRILEVTCDFAFFDDAVMPLVLAHRTGLSLGVNPVPGTMLFASGKTIRVLVNSAGNPINMPTALLVDAPDWNLASVDTKYKLVFRGYATQPGGTVFNAATS